MVTAQQPMETESGEENLEESNQCATTFMEDDNYVEMRVTSDQTSEFPSPSKEEDSESETEVEIKHRNNNATLHSNVMSWGKLLDLLSFSVFSIFSMWIGIVFLQETVDSIPCPQSY